MQQSQNEDIHVLALYKQFKGWATGDRIDANSIILLVTQLIPAVEKLVRDNHKGEYKKQIVLRTLKLIVMDLNVSEDQRNTLNVIIESTVPITIDTLISVARGQIDIGKLKKSFCFCF